MVPDYMFKERKLCDSSVVFVCSSASIHLVGSYEVGSLAESLLIFVIGGE